MFSQYGFQNLSLNLLLLFRWLQLLPVYPNISTSTLAVSLYIKSCTFFLFPVAWHFRPQVLPNQSICISYLLVFNHCNYTLLILKCCPSLLNNTGIRVCLRNFRNSTLFTATCKISVFSMCFCCQPCVQRPDIFRKPITSLKKILGSYEFFCSGFSCLSQYFYFIVIFLLL